MRVVDSYLHGGECGRINRYINCSMHPMLLVLVSLLVYLVGVDSATLLVPPPAVQRGAARLVVEEVQKTVAETGSSTFLPYPRGKKFSDELFVSLFGTAGGVIAIREGIMRLKNVGDEFSRTLSEARISLVSGAVAKAISIGMIHPLDTIKTRSQLDPAHVANLPPLSASNIFGGIKTSLFGAVPYGAITFASYEVIKTKMLANFGSKIRPEILLVSSAIMGDLIGSLWYCPIDLLKISKQSGMYSNSVEAFSSILKTRGVMGLYQGMAGHVIRDVPYRAIQLPMFDVLKTTWLEHKDREAMKLALAQRERVLLELEAKKKAKEEKNGLYRVYSRVKGAIRPPSGKEATEKLLLARKTKVLQPMEAMVLGGIASSIAAFATTPLDLLRTRLMTASLPDQSISTTVRALGSIAKDIVTHEGPMEFFRGTGLRVAYMGPGAGIFFLVFEYSKSELYRRDQEKEQRLLAAA